MNTRFVLSVRWPAGLFFLLALTLLFPKRSVVAFETSFNTPQPAYRISTAHTAPGGTVSEVVRMQMGSTCERERGHTKRTHMDGRDAGIGGDLRAAGTITLTVIGRYETGIFKQGAAEIVTYDPANQRLYVVNRAHATIDVLDIHDPTAPTRLSQIDITPYGVVANSVAFQDGVLAVAVENANKQQPGQAVFFDSSGALLSAVAVGALPDMITFTPDGRKVLVANEGEPDELYTNDPEGSVSIIDVSNGAANLTPAHVTTVRFTDFNVGGARHAELPAGVRVFGPDATVAADLEPEYIAVSADSSTAWVTLQENNAFAVIDINAMTVTRLVALGTKDHALPGNGLDASNRDGTINIANWPVQGMYQPDAIVAYEANGSTYLVTANEGDSRDYGGFSEEERVKSVILDPQAFPDAATLQDSENLGRLKISTVTGDPDQDGDIDQLYAFGARSFSIWSATGELVFDSGDAFEQTVAAAFPRYFNANNDDNVFDDRSDDKGPEPEALTVGVVSGRTYAFIGLERVGGIMVYEVTDPRAPTFVQYVNERDFEGDPVAGTAGDLGPEGLVFIAADDSPNGKPLLVVANEVSGSTTIYEITSVASPVLRYRVYQPLILRMQR